MEGYQFAHIETYAVKPANSNSPGSGRKRRNGDRKWSAADILAEAERLKLASRHVPDEGAPPELLPGDVATFADLRHAHKKTASKKETYVRTRKDDDPKEIRRSLRRDAPTLFTCIVSLPVLTVDALREPELRQDCQRLLRAAMEHERQRIEAVGGRMMLGVIHWDEEHVHAHFYALDKERGRVNRLHPGHAAKEAELAKLQGHGTKQEINRAGNRAYCDAMRAWQNDLHENVFDEAGLLRYGPRSGRLTRGEWKSLKAAKAQEAKDRKRQHALKEANAVLEVEIGALAQSLAAELERRRHLHQKEKDLEGRESDIIERRQQVEQDERTATSARTEAERLKAEAEAFRKALDVGSDAVVTRKIEYRAATEDRREGLGFGPNRPATEAAREALKTTVQPAYDYLVGFARKIARLWKREERQKRQEAEHRRQASVLRAAEERAGRDPSPSLADIAYGRRPDYCAEDFPDAWALGERTSVKQVASRLQGMRNLDLRACHQATSDAALLCQDSPILRGDFQRAVAVLEHTAKARGFDLESGRHDPAKATDPAEARRHMDQLTDPIRVKGAEKLRQRARR